jgi:phosphatidylethanolamine/phosphatidyl-N-methylethanolamine N-methyltransferase
MWATPESRGAEGALFFRHWLRHPLGIGAILPSSVAVARAMARGLPLHRQGAVLELGGGTGVVTKCLLDAGCPSNRLIVVEREPALAQILRRRFAQTEIVESDACDAAAILAARGITRLAAVVSSLPIKWFPLESQRAVVAPCLDLLGDGGAFLQLTNALVSPLPMAPLGLDGVEIARIWTQFPPVQIWRYARARTEEEGAARTQARGRRRRPRRGGGAR